LILKIYPISRINLFSKFRDQINLKFFSQQLQKKLSHFLFDWWKIKMDQLVDEDKLEELFCDEFHGNEELYVRDYLQNMDNPQLFSCYSRFSTLMKEYIRKNSEKTELFLIMMDEIQKSKGYSRLLEQVLEFIPLVECDSNILTFYKTAIQYNFEVYKNDYKFVIIEKMFMVGDVVKETELKLLFPEFRMHLFEADIDYPLLNLLSNIYSNIPIEDTLKLLEKIEIEFKTQRNKNQVILDFYETLFCNNFDFLRDYSARHFDFIDNRILLN
jgi:hypothetical protein